MHEAAAPAGFDRGSAMELLGVTLLAAVLLIAFATSGPGMQLSWDALNHHIYLGWTAEHPRFARDFLPAGYQSTQFPYLYWPVYRLAVGGASATTASVVLTALQSLAVPPLWFMARSCIPGRAPVDAVLRMLGVALALLTGAVLSLFDASSNDLLAAIPLVWAIALALIAVDPASHQRAGRWVALSGVLAGASVACKLSNGPIAILLPLLWFFAAPTAAGRARRVISGCAWTLVGTALTYWAWGEQLWVHFGNPFFPYFDDLFAPVRAAVGWHP